MPLEVAVEGLEVNGDRRQRNTFEGPNDVVEVHSRRVAASLGDERSYALEGRAAAALVTRAADRSRLLLLINREHDGALSLGGLLIEVAHGLEPGPGVITVFIAILRRVVARDDRAVLLIEPGPINVH